MATTKIRSSSIVDGQVSNADLSATVAVTGGQIADDAVTTAKILDDNVTTGKILDNNVTLAKMADGTQGDTLYYGAAGAPTLLAKPGTPADEVLTFATGATAPSWVAAGGGGGFAGVKVYTSGGTWTKATRESALGVTITKVIVEVQGGGGGGAQAYTGYSNYVVAGSGGGYAKKLLDVSSVTASTIIVGVAGAAQAGGSGPGGDGGDSSWADTVNTDVVGIKGVNNYSPSGTSPGGLATGGDINIQGGTGSKGQEGQGGSSQLGHGGTSGWTGTSTPTPGIGYGGGGGSAYVLASSAGSQGIVIVWEYQ
jgi:hypothetical protein